MLKQRLEAKTSTEYKTRSKSKAGSRTIANAEYW